MRLKVQSKVLFSGGYRAEREKENHRENTISGALKAIIKRKFPYNAALFCKLS